MREGAKTLEKEQGREFPAMEIKGTRKEFFSFEEFVLVLKRELLKDQRRLLCISKQISSIYKDRDINRTPEKILDIFQRFGLVLSVKTQKKFIAWFLKYNKFDFFQNFYVNIMILNESPEGEPESKQPRELPAKPRGNKLEEELQDVEVESLRNEIQKKNEIIELLSKKFQLIEDFVEQSKKLQLTES